MKNWRFVSSCLVVLFVFTACSAKKQQMETKTAGTDVESKVEKEEKIKVPNMDNRTLEEAKTIFNESNLTLGLVTEEYSDAIAKGKIMVQEPAAGSMVDGKTSVKLVVSKGPKEISEDEGAKLLQKQLNKGVKFWRTSNIGNKKYYWYSFIEEMDNMSDSVYCVEAATGTIFIYASTGDLYSLDNKLVSSQKADWQLAEENSRAEAEANRKLPFSGLWISEAITRKVDRFGNKSTINDSIMEFYISDSDNSIKIITSSKTYNMTYSYEYDKQNEIYFISLSKNPMKISYVTGEDGLKIMSAMLKDDSNGDVLLRKFTFTSAD